MIVWRRERGGYHVTVERSRDLWGDPVHVVRWVLPSGAGSQTVSPGASAELAEQVAEGLPEEESDG